MPPRFIPPWAGQSSRDDPGSYAEGRVLAALHSLGNDWIVFHSLEWRKLGGQGEQIGEIDLILFHPGFGLLVIEVKAGGISCHNGRWFYGSSTQDGGMREMKLSPLSQARRNRYALADKLANSLLDATLLGESGMTHTAWFPDIEWHAPSPPPELPTGGFILDRRHLINPETAIARIMRSASPEAQSWSVREKEILLATLAPEFNLLLSLDATLIGIREKILRATQSQLKVLTALRAQKRLLVEGCAGSGKTLLAVHLAREHVRAGKKVLFTCFNKNLAAHVKNLFQDREGITIHHFHELVRHHCQNAAMEFLSP